MVLDRVVGHAGVVTQPSGRHALPLGERVGYRRPAREQLVADAKRFGQVEEDVEVGPRLTRRLARTIRLAHAPFGVGVGPFLLAPDGGWQNEVRVCRRWRRMEAVLDDQELEPLERMLQRAEVR